MAEIAENPVPNVAAPNQLGLFTLEKFIKNDAKAFNGTIEPEKVKACTLNVLKTFRANGGSKESLGEASFLNASGRSHILVGSNSSDYPHRTAV